MPFYAAPGIYVEEVPSGARPIGAVGTSVAGFVGTAPDSNARRDEAVAVNNWSDFLRIFASTEAPSTDLARAVYGFFDNGGGRCYIVNIPAGAAIAGAGRRRSGLQLLEAVDEVAIVAAPGFSDATSYEALLSHCEKMEDRVAILDPPAEVPEIDLLTKVGTPTADKPARRGGNGEAEGSPPPPAASGDETGVRPRQSNYGAFYFPYIMVRDPLSGDNVFTPPSGHIAGVWARNDAQRGVHKAPANEPIRGAVDLAYRVTRPEQELLNPKGVNCIRYFTAEGIRIWGARMLAAEASEWRYVNVRRLFNMLKESIAEGTRWIVFEPNDFTLWRSIERDVSAFLKRVWRDGALLGRTPEEAFFVKCDEETNPPEVRDAGEVVTLIGLAPVKPAEFVVFKLSQTAGGAETEMVGT
jgi:phage tail sheath protein FI